MIGTIRRRLLDAYAHPPVQVGGISYQTAATTWAWFWRDLLIRIPPIGSTPAGLTPGPVNTGLPSIFPAVPSIHLSRIPPKTGPGYDWVLRLESA